MAGDRMVIVRLLGEVGQFRAAMAAAAASARGVQAAVNATNASVLASTGRMASAQRGMVTSMGGTFKQMRGMLVGMGLPLAIGLAAKQFFDFEQQMAHVKAVADKFGQSDAGFRQLHEAALTAGQQFGFSAVEVGKAEEALAKAGRSTSQILSGDLTASLALAAAGTIGLDEAARHIAVTMTIFKDQNLTAATVADKLTQAANATVSGVSEMGNAMSYVGPLADSLGVSFNDTVTTISLFNQAGIDGERAGTNLRGMLTNLLSPSHLAAKEMQKLGINLYDGEHKFVGMSRAADILKNSFAKLNPKQQADAIGKLTTNASMPGFIVLMRGGAQAIDDMQKAIDVQAKAAEVAKGKTSSVTGDFKKLGGAMTEAFVRVGEMAMPALSGLATGLTKVTQAFSHMGSAAQLSMLALGGFMMFGRQRLPRMVQGLQGGAMNFGLARAAQGNVNSLRAQTQAAEQAQRGMQPGSRMFNSQTAMIGGLRAQAAAAEQAAAAHKSLSASLGRLRGEWAATSGVMGRGALVARGAGAVMGAAGKGLMGALGGPWGLAITGALVGLSLFQAKQNDAARKAEESAARVEQGAAGLTELGIHYAQVGTLSDDAAQQMIRSNKPLETLISNSQKYGVSLSTVARAAMHDARAQETVGQSYQQRINDLTSLQTAIGDTTMYGPSDGREQIGESNRGYNETLTATQRQRARRLGVLGSPKDGFWDPVQAAKTQQNISKALKATKEEKEAWDKQFKDTAALDALFKRLHEQDLANEMKKFGLAMEGASVASRNMMDSLVVMNAADAKFGDRIQGMTANMGNLTASFTAVADAQAAFWKGAQEDLPDAFVGKDAKGAEVKAGPKIDPITGGFDVADTQGRKQFAALKGMADASSKVVTDVFTMTASLGQNTAEAMSTAGLVATAAFMKERDAAAAALKTAGLTQTQIAGVLDATYALPQDVALNIDAQGAEEVIGDLKHLGVEIVSLPQGKVGFVSNTAAEAAKAKAFGGTIRAIPGSKKVLVVFSDPANAAKAIAELTRPKTVPIKYVIHAPSRFERTEAAKVPPPVFMGSANAVEHAVAPQQVKATITPSVDQGAAGAVTGELDALASPRPAEITPHVGDTSAIMAQLNSFHGSATVDVHVNMPSIPSSISAPPPLAPAKRWGGVHSFAQGAMVGRGDLIRWAEPETGGEAYIPRLGDAARSKAILAQAAQWYGMGVHTLAAGGITAFAAGGIGSGGGGGLSNQSAPLSDFLSRYLSTPDNWSTRRTAAIIDQRDAVISVKEAEKSLAETRRDKKHTALDMRKAENALADARRKLVESNNQLGKARQQPRDQFKKALDTGVRNTGGFIANLNALAARGYGSLAMQLLQMGGPEAEAIAAGARKWSTSILGRVNTQVQNAQAQQKMMTNMPAMLAIRSAVAKGQSYASLVGSGEFTTQDINTALALMQGELSKTTAGRLMLASLHGDTAAALGAKIRGYATGGIAGPGTLYRFAEPASGGEAVIPRIGSGAVPILKKAAAWHGLRISDGPEPWQQRSVSAQPVQVQITVRGEGVLAAMIDTRVNGALAQVARTVTRGRSGQGF